MLGLGGVSGIGNLEEKPKKDFRNPANCQQCAYFGDCIEFFNYCPYSGKLAVEKRNNVEILEEAEVLV
jgi:hypothetical protein